MALVPEPPSRSWAKSSSFDRLRMRTSRSIAVEVALIPSLSKDEGGPPAATIGLRPQSPTIAASFSTVFQLRAVPTGAFLVFFQSRSSIDSPMPSMKSM